MLPEPAIAARTATHIVSRLRRAYRALRCKHTGGLVYVARRRIDDRWFEFSRCECGHVFTWFEREEPDDRGFTVELAGSTDATMYRRLVGPWEPV
jgi:hypothetical protein